MFHGFYHLLYKGLPANGSIQLSVRLDPSESQDGGGCLGPAFVGFVTHAGDCLPVTMLSQFADLFVPYISRFGSDLGASICVDPSPECCGFIPGVSATGVVLGVTTARSFRGVAAIGRRAFLLLGTEGR